MQLVASLLLFWFSIALLLSLTLSLQSAPLASRSTLRQQIILIRQRWFDRLPPKPKTPKDCPLCADAHSSRPPRPVPLPYASFKSPRGRKKRSTTHGLACFNPDCAYFAISDAALHALVSDGWRSQHHDIRRIRYPACHHVCSIRRGSPVYRLHTPLHTVEFTFLRLVFGRSRADIARLLGLDDQTVARWLDRFGTPADPLHHTLLRDLTPATLQLDALVAALRGCRVKQWLWLALDPKTKLVLRYHLAARTLQAAMPFAHHLRDRLQPSYVPVFLSDSLRQYFGLLTAHFGTWHGRSWRVLPQLTRAQIVKVIRGRR